MLKFRVFDKEKNKMIKNIKDSVQILLICENYNNNYILMESVGIKDRYRNDIFDEDYILYDSGIVKFFIQVKRGKVEFTFRRWDKYDDKWKRCTYQGIDTYGQVIGNIYEGIKSKRILNEMLEQGIEI